MCVVEALGHLSFRNYYLLHPTSIFLLPLTTTFTSFSAAFGTTTSYSQIASLHLCPYVVPLLVYIELASPSCLYPLQSKIFHGTEQLHTLQADEHWPATRSLASLTSCTRLRPVSLCKLQVSAILILKLADQTLPQTSHPAIRIRLLQCKLKPGFHLYSQRIIVISPEC